MNITYRLFLCCLMGIVMLSCSKESSPAVSHAPDVPILPEVPDDYLSAMETEGLFVHSNEPFDNVTTNEGAQLGRVLFYDPDLSLNGRISCGTCHLPEFSFADGRQFSSGFGDELTHRNTPSLINLQFSNTFFWDMSQSVLEEQVLLPVQNHIEMGIEDLDYLAEKLSAKDYYPNLFNQAFGSSVITQENIGKALAQFVRSINSNQSKFDLARDNDFEDFTAIERAGMQVFARVGCNDCHSVLGHNLVFGEDGGFFPGGDEGSFYGGTGGDAANIGLDLAYADQGMGQGIFKVPSLRNIGMTAPYMHDGRFNTLDEVLDHYQYGVQDHPNLDNRLKSSNREMNTGDREALKSFLMTLQDESFVLQERFSDPFVR